MTANYRAVGPECRVVLYESALIVFVAFGVSGAWSEIVREHHGRAAENIVFKLNALIYGHVVLDFHAAADLDIIGNVYVLAEGAVLAYCCSRLHVREAPDLGSGTDGNIVVYYAGGVEVVGHCVDYYRVIVLGLFDQYITI